MLNVRSNDESKIDTRDLQPEIFYHIKREFVEFDKFDSYEKVAISLRKLSGRLENESKVSFLMQFCPVCSLNFQKIIE